MVSYKLHISILMLSVQIVGAQTNSVPPARAASYSDSSSGAGNLPTQRIGPDDLISISVYDAPEFSRSVRVSSDGSILLPMMNSPIPAAGLMPHELEARIVTALKAEHLLKNPSVVVTVAEYQGRTILVTGAVKAPVSFQAIGRVTLMDAITKAGGIAPDAGTEIVVSSSKGGSQGSATETSLLRRIPIKLLLGGTDPKLNIELSGGDEVRIPVAGRISVLGNVKNSGSYAITDTADTSVLGALVLAGGFVGPKPKEAYIIRQDDTPQGKHSVPIPLKDIVDRKVPDVPLVAHDILFVPNNRRAETLQSLERLVGAGGSAAFMINVLK